DLAYDACELCRPWPCGSASPSRRGSVIGNAGRQRGKESMKRLTGKVAWVTGAGSGIGEAGALALAEEGASMMLTGRRKETLEAVATRIAKSGGAARVHQGDMARAED